MSGICRLLGSKVSGQVDPLYDKSWAARVEGIFRFILMCFHIFLLQTPVGSNWPRKRHPLCPATFSGPRPWQSIPPRRAKPWGMSSANICWCRSKLVGFPQKWICSLPKIIKQSVFSWKANERIINPPFPNRLGYCAGIWYVIFQAVPRSTPLGRPQHEIPGFCCSPWSLLNHTYD